MRKRSDKIGDWGQVPTAPLSQKQAFEKAAAYCATQERSVHQVVKKLYGWEQSEDSVTAIISQLEAESYLNTERFALSYARGKFHQNRWGRLRILQGLKAHEIPESLIDQALKSLESEYDAQVFSLGKSKWSRLTDTDLLARKAKTYRYLLSKGYAPSEIYPVLNQLAEAKGLPGD